MKRIISFVLCLSMLLSMVPMNVFAADVEETTPVTETFPTEESTAPAQTTEATLPAETEATTPDTSETTVPEVTAETLPAVTQPALQETVPAETEAVTVSQVFTWVPEADLPSDEELFVGYAQQQFYGDGPVTFGTAGRDTLDDGNRLFYDALAKQIKKIAAGERDSAVIAVGYNLGEQTINSVTYPCIVDPEDEIDISDVELDLSLLLDALLEDFPYELYWFDKTCGISCVGLSDEDKNTGEYKVCYLFSFAVSPHYSATGAEDTTDVNTSLTGAATASAENARNIVEIYADRSDYQKLKCYKDKIMSLTEYNHSAASASYAGGYGDPWQLIWVFDNNTSTKVVCEGYAKAFQYLCDLSDFDNDITAYTVVGYLNPPAAGYNGHMWNVVNVNGSSYLVDVTNCDTGFSLFLRGGAISKGVHYYDYDAGTYVADNTIDGTYTFDGCKFVYDLESIENWGTEVTTLATEDLTESNFPTVETDGMTGEELAAMLAGAEEVTVEKTLTVASAVTVPAGKRVIVTGTGNVQVADGGALTVEGQMDLAATGMTVCAGGSLALQGSGLLDCYGNGSVTMEDGAVWTVLDDAQIRVGQNTVLTGIAKSEVCSSGTLFSGDGLAACLTKWGAGDYKTFRLDIPSNYTISETVTLPENVTVTSSGNTVTLASGCILTLDGSWVLGNDENSGRLVLESGNTLVVNGSLELANGSALTIDAGAKLVNAGTITVPADCTLTNNGTVENSGVINGTVGGSGSVTEPAMTGEELVELLEGQTGTHYQLFTPVEITSNITLPAIDVWVWGNGSITVKDGGSLTLTNTLDVANGGSLTVEEGGSLSVNSVLCAAGGGTIDIQGSIALGEHSRVVVNYPGTITGIDASDIHLYAPVWSEESLLDALTLQGYASSELIIPGSDLDADGKPDPIVLTKDLTIPDNWTVSIGDELGAEAVFEIGEGVTLTNNGYAELWHGSTLIVRDGAAIAGSGTIASDGAILNYGTIENTITGFGIVTEYMTQARFEALLENASEITVDRLLTLTGKVTIPAGKTVTVETPGTMTVAEGGELTVEGNLDFPGTSLTVQNGGSLTLRRNGNMGFYGSSALTIEEGAAYEILDQAEIYANLGAILTGITKAEVVNSNFLENPEDNLQEVAEAFAEGYKKFYLSLYTDYTVSEDMTLPENVVLLQYGTTLTVTNDATLTVNGDWELGMEVIVYATEQVGGHIVIEDGTVVVNGALALKHGSSLTVASGSTLTSNGRLSTDASCAVENRGTIKVNGSFDSEGEWTGDSAVEPGNMPATQTELEERLKTAKGDVYLAVPLVLNKDLTIPETAQLVITDGGSLTIPAQRTLTIDGTLVIRGEGRISAVEGGQVINNGCLRNEAALDLTDGIYVHGENAELIMAYSNEGDENHVAPTMAPKDLHVYTTMTVEGWSLAQLYAVLNSFASDKLLALEIRVTGDLTLSAGGNYGSTWTLPEYAALYVENGATLTVPRSCTLVNNGAIGIFEGSTLRVESGGKLLGSLPVCVDGGVYENKNVTVLTSLTANRTLTGPTKVSGMLEIPAGVTLTISGSGASLVLEDGAELINSGSIIVEKDATLDASRGTYSGSGTLDQNFLCGEKNTVTRATVLGIEPGLIRFTAETKSGDAVIREAIAYVGALVESGRIPGYEQGGFFRIRFAGETVLSADLELPRYSDALIPATGALTVPEGMTLTDHSGMGVYGTLIAKGTVAATGFPMMIAGQENLVNPENCTNFYYDDLALEAITVSADRDTAPVGETIALSVSSWMPEHARYFGDYTVSFDQEGICGYGWNDYGELMISADQACDVTVTVTATAQDGTVLKNSSEEPISGSVLLHFTEKKLYLFVTETPDFWEDANNGICGLYPGGSLTYYANTTGINEIDESITWPDYSEYSEYITTSVDGGALTITAKKTLPGTAVIDICPLCSDPAAAPYCEQLYLRPKATAVDIVMDGQAVTGKTVSFDLNGDADTVSLSPLATPEDAYASHMASGKTALVQWKSSNEAIATVDDSGNVTFTGEKTGKVKITMTANFGVKKTAAVTFNAVKLATSIESSDANTARLIGGSGATYTVTDENGTAQKSSAVEWFLCDQEGNAVESHPYAAVTAAGKLTTKAVSDEINVYLMAQVKGKEEVRLSEPVLVELYPAVSTVEILVGSTPISGTLLYDLTRLSDTYPLSWSAGPYLESVKEVSWKSSAAKIATISEEGVITVLKPGTAKFTLTVTALNNKKTTATVTMKFGIFTRGLELSALLPDGSVTGEMDYLTLYSGKSITFAAENQPETVTAGGVKWSVDNTKLATISSAGVLKAKNVTTPAVVTVLVQSKDGAYAEEIPVLILPKLNADGLDPMVLYTGDAWDGYSFLTKTTRTMAPGETLQVFASDYTEWNDGTADGFEIFAAEDAEWTSAKPAVAEVDENGRITAKTAGTAKITVEDGYGRTAYFNVKVSKSSLDVTITQKKTGAYEGLAVASGKSLDLVGTVEYTDGSEDTKVNWAVSDTSLATISTSGRLTAVKGLTERASVTVYAYATDGTGAFDTIDVAITPLITGVEIFGSFGSAFAKDVSNTTQKWDLTTQESTLTLTAKTFPENAMGVTWKSSSKAIAEIGEDSGVVTCKKAGTVTITATAKDGSGKKATFKLTVHRTMREGSLTLPESAIVGGGKKLTFTKLEGYGIDTEATNKKLTWSLAYPNGWAVPKTVATLSTSGVLTTKAVTAPVNLVVTAAATDGSGEKAVCRVTVYPVIKGVTLYAEDEVTSLNKKTVTIPISEALTVLPDATNVKGFGYGDDKTADEYLENGEAWDITLSKQLVTLAFDGQKLTVQANENAQVGDSVKITLKATDGSNKSAYFTVKFG